MPFRPSYFEIMFAVAKIVAKRSTCLRRQVGCAIAKNQHILTTGYNGAPANVQHCEIRGCLRDKLKVPSGQRHELCYGAHAETNAIAQAAFHGVSLEDAMLFCTHAPCSMCMKSIINAGIAKVIYIEGYPDELTEELLTSSPA